MIAIVVGSVTKITKKQIKHIEESINDANKILYKDVCLYYVGNDNYTLIKEHEFIEGLLNSKVLIMSGGETAYSLLNASGFDYLISNRQIMPLISTGTINGGLLHGKKYVIKGGSIGDVNVYNKIMEYINNKICE